MTLRVGGKDCTTIPCVAIYSSENNLPAICYALDRSSFNQGINAQYDIGIDDSGIAQTLVAKGPGAVAFVVPLGFRPENTRLYEEVSTTICNGTNPGHHQGVCILDRLTIELRRLTPTECARLQGFPDNWCADLGTENPTDDEMNFWRKVFKTYSEVTGGKMKSDKQVAKWLKDPYSDSAEYKMWGNGVALPCVWFVLCGIVWAEKIEAAD